MVQGIDLANAPVFEGGPYDKFTPENLPSESLRYLRLNFAGVNDRLTEDQYRRVLLYHWQEWEFVRDNRLPVVFSQPELIRTNKGWLPVRNIEAGTAEKSFSFPIALFDLFDQAGVKALLRDPEFKILHPGYAIDEEARVDAIVPMQDNFATHLASLKKGTRWAWKVNMGLTTQLLQQHDRHLIMPFLINNLPHHEGHFFKDLNGFDAPTDYPFYQSGINAWFKEDENTFFSVVKDGDEILAVSTMELSPCKTELWWQDTFRVRTEEANKRGLGNFAVMAMLAQAYIMFKGIKIFNTGIAKHEYKFDTWRAQPRTEWGLKYVV